MRVLYLNYVMRTTFAADGKTLMIGFRRKLGSRIAEIADHSADEARLVPTNVSALSIVRLIPIPIPYMILSHFSRFWRHFGRHFGMNLLTYGGYTQGKRKENRLRKKHKNNRAFAVHVYVSDHICADGQHRAVDHPDWNGNPLL